MALTDEQELYNDAMALIGEHEVTEGLTAEKQYVLCERHYPYARDEALSRHYWNEAMKQAVLIQESPVPLFDYEYKFALPSDCILVRSIGIDTDMWEVRGGYIYTNSYISPAEYDSDSVYYEAGQYISYSDVTYKVDTSFTSSDWTTDLVAYLTSQTEDYGILNLDYVYRLEDVTAYSANLRKVIAYTLAIKVSVPITNGHDVKVELLNELENIVMPEVRTADSMQGRLKPIFISKFLRSRG